MFKSKITFKLTKNTTFKKKRKKKNTKPPKLTTNLTKINPSHKQKLSHLLNCKLNEETLKDLS